MRLACVSLVGSHVARVFVLEVVEIGADRGEVNLVTVRLGESSTLAERHLALKAGLGARRGEACRRERKERSKPGWSEQHFEK